MNIEEEIDKVDRFVNTITVILPKYSTAIPEYCIDEESWLAIKKLLTAYEKEKGKNKNAIDFINKRKKKVNKNMAEGTRLQVGTFMWQVDELLEILKGVEEE